MRRFLSLAIAALFALNCPLAYGQIVINEIAYDDSGAAPDDLEFIELYNAGESLVDISGWFLAGQDEAGPNFQPQATFTIPASTMLAAGDYYVIANPSVPMLTSWLVPVPRVLSRTTPK